MPSKFKSETEHARWELVKMIQSRPRSQGSGVFSVSTLVRLYQALQEEHPSYSDEDLQEKSKLSEAIHGRITGTASGALNWAEISSLELILNTPFLDFAEKESQELLICQDEVKATLQGRRTFPSASERRLERLLRRALRYSSTEKRSNITSLIDEIKSFQGKEVELRKSLLRTCLETLDLDKVPAGQTRVLEQNHTTETSHPLTPQTSSPTEDLSVIATEQPVEQIAGMHVKQASIFAANVPAVQPERAPTPNSALSDRLFNNYTNNEFPFIPIFHLPLLSSIHETSKCTENTMTESQTAILNLCFALVCVGPRAPVFPKAIYFYKHGRSLLHSIEESGDSLSLLQCYILQVQYLHATGNLRAAWELIGLTIRRAQALGIHLKNSGGSVMETQQITRRIWHTIQIVERSLALHLGLCFRSLDSTCDAPLPLSIADDWANGMPEISDGSPSTSLIAFLKANAELYQVVDDVMDVETEFRITKTGCPLEQMHDADLDDVRKVDKTLISWKAALPGFLQEKNMGDYGNDQNPIIHRLRLSLQLRHLYIRLRLYRPLLIQAFSLSLRCECTSPGEAHMTGREYASLDAPLLLGLIRDASFKCLDAAHGIIKMLWRYMGNSRSEGCCGNASAARENLDHLYASGLVLIAARMIPFLMDRGKGRSDSIKYINAQLNVLHLLFRKFEQSSRQNQDMHMQFNRCTTALMRLSEAAGDANNPGIISGDVGLDPDAWSRLYVRIKVQLPSQTSTDSPVSPWSPSPTNASMLFGWLESLPVDLDD
ncbi:uncharacterized protein N7459_003374 [Penicillium hispanicum]|uniref:uncharacterized protein n=1 Tax=Penicillium hispanicum TaxID=1080232 RepID=UPI002540D4EA|nr:uncharacterized protein N7459_003374 [Penicillium hispanicum]KAJ5587609.1 hypothetical protein N7459_003374 [Penicillium hispanicum]